MTAFGPELDDLDIHEDLVYYPVAAEIAGVPETTVRQWKSRRHLHPAAWDGKRPLFRPLDVLRAEAQAHATPQGRRRQAG